MSQRTAEDVVQIGIKDAGMNPAEIVEQVEAAMAATTDEGKTLQDLDPAMYAYFAEVVQVAKRYLQAMNQGAQS